MKLDTEIRECEATVASFRQHGKELLRKGQDGTVFLGAGATLEDVWAWSMSEFMRAKKLESLEREEMDLRSRVEELERNSRLARSVLDGTTMRLTETTSELESVRLERDCVQQENEEWRKSSKDWADLYGVAELEAECASLRQGVERLTKRLGAFLEIAERSKEASDRTWARARKMQDLATMARNGQQEEAKRQLAMIDGAPVVSDFGNIAERLEAEIKPARVALRETEGLVCKHLEAREAPMFSPPGMVECARCRTLVPSKGLAKP